MFTSDLFSKKIRFYVSKSEYYDTITTDNSYLKAIADDLNITRKEDRETDSKILFNNKLKLNCKYRDIVDTLGTPAYETIKNLTQQHSVLFYKKKIGGYKIRLEIHVIKNVFLVGFITFNLTSKARKKDLINLVTNKYINEDVNVELNDFRIYNSDREYIKVINSVDLTLVYGINSKSNNEIISHIAKAKELKILSEDQQNNLIVYDNI